MAIKLEGGGGKALVAQLLVARTFLFFAASLSYISLYFIQSLVFFRGGGGLGRGWPSKKDFPQEREKINLQIN